MNVHDSLFWFFSLAMLLCGVLVISSRNPVSSAMYLVALFVFMAGLFVSRIEVNVILLKPLIKGSLLFWG